MAWFDDPISALGATENVFGISDIFLILLLTTALCLVIARTYRLTHSSTSYSKSFVQIIVVFGVVVSMVMLIIGTNIARAFTLLGALSIIRFRNAVKDSRDVGFIFLMMVVGMAVGTRFYILAVIMTAFVCLLIIAMHWMNFGGSTKKEELLKVMLPSKTSIEGTLSKVFASYLSNYQFLSTESTGKKGFNWSVFLVTLKDKAKTGEFVDKIKEATGNEVYLTETDYLVN
ncbi:MAG TPA: DUF4956 domain-containing protein [archaeon]|nr:DUF4956 domain-containing protein [archaeon]